MPRLTSHGEVVFEANSQGRILHPFWGDFRQYWPGQPAPAQSKPGCGSCGGHAQPPAPAAFATVENWFAAVQKQPSDFHEHMDTLKRLATGADTVVELSHWLKPSCLSLAAGRPQTLRSICPGAKPEWPQLKTLLAPGTDLQAVQSDILQAEPIPCDLLFVDTLHQADRLVAELARWSPLCRHYVVVHTTITFGETGDDGGPGVLAGLRRFLRENKQWFVAAHYNNNHGLAVLSCDPADKKSLPSTLKQAWNYSKAWAAHVASGRQTLPQADIDARLDICLTCDQRVDNRCSVCGCFLDSSPDGKEGKAVWSEQTCPLGRWAH